MCVQPPTGDGWVVGDQSGVAFPAHAGALRDGGTTFLTRAFHASKVLGSDNTVTGITHFEEIPGGSTGRKLLLSVRFRKPAPGLHTDLFVKFSRDFDDPIRDRGRTQMESEVRFASLALTEGFPIAVPRPQFGDYHCESGTGILITERIAFGTNGIEPQYHKCLDYRMPEPVPHYRALLTALARLAGTHRSGLLPAHLAERFPVDISGATVGEQAPLSPERLERRLTRLAEFAEDHPGLLPANVRSRRFMSRLRQDAPRFLAGEPAVWRYLAADPDYIALCHWNANVDNAWFFRDTRDTLHCGLMDWGCVGQMNIAMAIWGAMSGAETGLWDHHLDELMGLFVAEVGRCGGPELDPGELARQTMLYAAIMGITWLLDVPALVRARFGSGGQRLSRFDPAIRDDESVRAPLQMLTNVLNLWQAHDVGRMLDAALSARPARSGPALQDRCR